MCKGKLVILSPTDGGNILAHQLLTGYSNQKQVKQSLVDNQEVEHLYVNMGPNEDDKFELKTKSYNNQSAGGIENLSLGRWLVAHNLHENGKRLLFEAVYNRAESTITYIFQGEVIR